MRWLQANGAEALELLLQHLWLSVLPTVLGLIVSLPIGWLAHRVRPARAGIVGTAALIYTVPSLAMFVLLPQVLGTKILDPVNVVVALTLYTVALLVRSVVDGLDSVPADVEQAATAMGYRRWQRLVLVELPVAVPVIAAGTRVAIVSNVSLVTVAALIGIPQLGSLFTQGFSRRLFEPIVVGIVACLLLALVLDLLVVAGGRLLTPWRRAVAR